MPYRQSEEGQVFHPCNEKSRDRCESCAGRICRAHLSAIRCLAGCMKAMEGALHVEECSCLCGFCLQCLPDEAMDHGAIMAPVAEARLKLVVEVAAQAIELRNNSGEISR